MSLLWNIASRSMSLGTQRFATAPVVNTLVQPLSFQSLRYKSTIKTIPGVKKRFSLRGGGSIKRRRAGASHNTGYKTRKRSNHLASSTGISGKKIEQRIRKMLGCF